MLKPDQPCPACEGRGVVERRCQCAGWVGPWCPYCESWQRWTEPCATCGGSCVVAYLTDDDGTDGPWDPSYDVPEYDEFPDGEPYL